MELRGLLGSAVFVYSRDPRSRLHRTYALLALSCSAGSAPLFVFGSLPRGTPLLLVGRANFAAAALVATTGCLFVAELAGRRLTFLRALWLEALLLAGLSLATPLVDRAEAVQHGQHLTVYGPLFSFYILHVAAFLGTAVILAFWPLPKTRDTLRRQMRLVGGGILATALVGVTTNVLLPYGFGNFHFIHVGTLSTILLLLAVGYAVFAYHLFSIRVVIRATFIFAGLIALALEVYNLALSFLAHLLPFGNPQERSFAATALVLVVNAFTQEPVRRWLEQLLKATPRRTKEAGRTNSNSRR